MKKDIDFLARKLEKLFVLSFMDLKLKYQGGVLGFFWSFFKPLIQFFAYYLVFGVILNVGKEAYYPLEVFLGILTWGWFSESTQQGLVAFLNKKAVITKVATNKLYPPVAAFLSPTMNYILNLGVFFVAYLFFTQGGLFFETAYPFWKSCIIFLFSFSSIACVSISLNILLSYLNARYRDVQTFWELALMYGIFLTPIFYVLPLPVEYQSLYFVINPLALPILLLKSLFFPISLPDLSIMTYFFYVIIMLSLLSGSLIYHAKTYKKIADYL